MSCVRYLSAPCLFFLVQQCGAGSLLQQCKQQRRPATYKSVAALCQQQRLSEAATCVARWLKTTVRERKRKTLTLSFIRGLPLELHSREEIQWEKFAGFSRCLWPGQTFVKPRNFKTINRRSGEFCILLVLRQAHMIWLTSHSLLSFVGSEAQPAAMVPCGSTRSVHLYVCGHGNCEWNVKAATGLLSSVQ